MKNDNESLNWTMCFTGVVVFALICLASASMVWERYAPLGRTPNPRSLTQVSPSP